MIEGVFIDSTDSDPAIKIPASRPVLRRGSRGPDVSTVQRILKERERKNLAVDGAFGPATEAAIKDFQVDNGLTASGVTDVGTWAALEGAGAKRSRGVSDDISSLISRMTVSLTMGAVSQVSLEISDPGLRFLAANYFQVRRVVRWQDLVFEIAAVEIMQGQAGEMVRVDCRSRAAQRMKRKKGKNLFTGGSATAYAAAQARQFGLSYFGERTAKKNNIVQSQSSDQADESVWSVLQRLANENQFMMFETDNRLFFASQQFLLGKFALVGIDGEDPNFLSTPLRWLDTSEDGTVTRIPRIVGPKGSPVLRVGSTGEHVKFLHAILRSRTGDAEAAQETRINSTSRTTNGVTRTTNTTTPHYGPKTEAAVKRIQRDNGLRVTGVVDRSTWEVLRSLAAAREEYRGQFFIRTIECPTIRRSDDDYFAATIQFRCEYEIGRKLRPGMTVFVEDIPNFKTNFLISEVTWEEGTNNPVTVNGLTPQYPEDAKLARELASRVDLDGGGFSSINYDDALDQND